MNGRVCLLCLFFLVVSITATTQPGHDRYNQFKQAIQNLKNDTNKVLCYLKFAKMLEPFSGDTVLAITKRARDLSVKLNYQRGIELSIYGEGLHAEYKLDYPAAIRNYREAMKIAEVHKLYTDIYGKYFEIYEIYNSALNLYYYNADYPNAMEIAQKGLSVAELLNDKEGRAHYTNQIGFIYLKQERADESIKYYTQYLKLAYQNQNKMMIADACNSIADAYLQKNEYKTSLLYLFRALDIYDGIKRSADGNEVEKFDGVIVAERYERVAYTLFKISTAYKLAGNYNYALHYSQLIFDIYNNKRKGGTKDVFNKYDLASYYINEGDIFRSLKDYKHADTFLNKGLSIARSIHHREDIGQAYDALAKTYAGLLKYDSAYIYSTLHTQLKDSVKSEGSRLKIAVIQARYDDERKSREMASQKLLRNIVIVAFVVFIAILFLSYSSYLLKQKNKYQLQVNKQQTDLFNAVVLAQDNERKRIAQDIHDSLGSMLSAAKLTLSGLEDDKSRFTGVQKEKYQTVLAFLDDASAELRNISQNLMPATLLKLGLIAALQNLFDKISATGIPINFTAYEVNERLEEALEISIYRIVLELVNNAVKHARAGEVTVQLIKYPSYINITVEDNGRGFIYRQATAKTKGVGLSSISSRIAYLKGTMYIDSGEGRGTTVIIDIPLNGNTKFMV